MGGKKEFIIPFGNLGKGEHEFEFEVDSTFFKQFDESIIQDGQVSILVVLEKKEGILLLDFTLQGKVVVACDRCLEELELELEGYNELIVKIGKPEEDADSEDILYLSPREHELDISQLIYEYITVMIPMRNVHEDEDGNPECRKEALENIEKHLAHEPKEDEEPPTDPRWDILKGINLN